MMDNEQEEDIQLRGEITEWPQKNLLFLLVLFPQ